MRSASMRLARSCAPWTAINARQSRQAVELRAMVYATTAVIATERLSQVMATNARRTL
jgi:hypothetical protein